MDDLISRQATIDALDKHCDIVCQYSKKQRSVMCGACPLGTAFDVIEDLPSAHRFDEWCTDCKEYDHERHCCPRFNHVIRTTLQEVQEGRKKGKWIKATGMMPPEFHGHHCCSECGNFANMEPPFGNREDLSKFCPNCGANMRGEEEE